ncbi:hypothetical protein WR164_00330 [Philodulcilactobacillus myokoensis]|uniref:Lysozyme n=1 Tax=Philodulcilactobacillus myokoensis TaxID=2929573 RepID=A0A9W6AY21_9LACO|nr:GH25 family lysozyme [Philodulcilactobacillus myokoensis]GLB46054.1 hypothetical protein WR164_00330 [Philodulcilactobacillus myokoensis]
MKINYTLKKVALGIGISFVSLFTFAAGNHAFAMSSMKPAFDISNYQGFLSDNEAQGLKNETSFDILNAQQGTYRNYAFSNNSAELNKYNIPFGIYSFATYNSVAQAQNEAQSLYNQDPNAKFYVNDVENNATGTYYPPSAATIAWAQTMHSLTNRPVILYSDQSYMTNAISADARNAYDTLWLAAYPYNGTPDPNSEPDPSYHYDLWQYSNSYPSVSLGQEVDASVIPDQGKPLSYWTGNSSDDNQSTQITQPSNTNNSGSTSQNNSDNSDNNQQTNQNNQSNNNQAEQNAKNQAAINKAKQVAKQHQEWLKQQAKKKAKAKAIAKQKAIEEASKKAARKAAAQRRYIHAHYYSSNKIKKFRVTAKNGINVYYHGKKVNHFKRGVVVKVSSFNWYRNMTKATNSYGATFTSNKKCVKAIWR